MATRPVFIPDFESFPYVKERFVEFEWFPGFSLSQAQKSIKSLHQNAAKLGISNVLEISTKSPDRLGKDLSAFNLEYDQDGIKLTVECAFQGSKVFEKGGPYQDLYGIDSRSAKKDTRLQDSGELIAFHYFKKKFPTEPKTAFYDWLYIKALNHNRTLAEKLINFRAFSDIAFNPKRSINCQARAAALYNVFYKNNWLENAVQDIDFYFSIIQSVSSEKEDLTVGSQTSFLDEI